MKKNVASQVVGAQINSKTDGSPVTAGTTTVYVTGDGGTQAAGSVGSGACTHEGHGFWTYTPAQAETNYDHVAFSFENSTGVNATVQIYPSFPQTGDNYARLGAPAGASLAADVAATKALLPTALVGGKMDSHVNDIANNAITAASINADAITDAKVASDVTIASVTGAVGSVTGAVGSVTGLTASDVGAIKAKTDNLPAAPAAVGDIPTAVQNADTLLNRDMSTGSDSGSTTVRTPRQALRFLRNKWDIAGGTLTVKKEDDSTTSWTSAISSDAAAVPVIGSDPAG